MKRIIEVTTHLVHYTRSIIKQDPLTKANEGGKVVTDTIHILNH